MASVGRNFSIASMSPVSATTVVYLRNCSSRFCGIFPPGEGAPAQRAVRPAPVYRFFWIPRRGGGCIFDAMLRCRRKGVRQHAKSVNVPHRHWSPAVSGPTPAGVPVSSKIARLKRNGCRDIAEQLGNRKDEIERRAVLASSSPLTRVSTVSPFSGSTSSLTTGPTGQNVSKPLARVHWPSFFCRSRAVTSLAMV